MSKIFTICHFIICPPRVYRELPTKCSSHLAPGLWTEMLSLRGFLLTEKGWDKHHCRENMFHRQRGRGPFKRVTLKTNDLLSDSGLARSDMTITVLNSFNKHLSVLVPSSTACYIFCFDSTGKTRNKSWRRMFCHFHKLFI